MQRNIVLDTNCLLQVISRKGKSYPAWKAFLAGEYNLCVTSDILDEYEEILDVKANPVIAAMVLEIIRLAPNTIMVDAHYKWNLIKQDPDDNKFVDCAVVANADFIVSEDKHFKELESVEFPKVVVVRLQEFMQLLRITKIN